jgi:hypothetical protein
MPSRPFLLLGAACALALGCAAKTLAYHEQSIELNAAGSDPWERGGTQDRIVGVLEARGYTVQHVNLRAPRFGDVGLRAPWGIRIRPDGWDQIGVIRVGGSNAGQLPLSYRWVVRARTFAADGAERSASAEAQADVDSIMAELNTVDTPERAPRVATGTESTTGLGNAWVGGRGTCSGGRYVGAFVALPPWAGAPAMGTNADRIVATLEAGGWTIVEAFPYASLGMLVAQRTQSAGSDGLTVFAIRAADPSGYDIRTWYEVRARFCDSAGRRGRVRAETRAEADRLVVALRDAIGGER